MSDTDDSIDSYDSNSDSSSDFDDDNSYDSRSDSRSDSSYDSRSHSSYDFRSDSTHDSSVEWGFNEGIECALKAISFPPNEREIMTRDAQIIQNKIIECSSKHDSSFRHAFRGPSLAGSFLDNVRINLPDEYDLNLVISLPLMLRPVSVVNAPGFIFLRVVGGDWNHSCVRRNDQDYFVNRLDLQQWIRSCFLAAMSELQYVQVSRRRSYSLEYIARGTGVAHTFKATEQSSIGRVIHFHIVPSFEFECHEWPNGVNKVPNQNLNWFAVPRKYHKRNLINDPLSFIIAAPHFERLPLKNKKNLKNSMRLMKAFRDAYKMEHLSSFLIKTIYLNVCNKKKTLCWSQSPGRLLIRMLVILLECLIKRNIPFYLDPRQNCLERLHDDIITNYIRKTRRGLKKLISCRNYDSLTDDDLLELFGVTYE